MNETPSGAMTTWEQMIAAARLLLDHLREYPTLGADLRVLLANQALAILVTGYEGYCVDRFVEMICAGWPVDQPKLDRRLVPPEKHGALAEIPASIKPATPEFARMLIKRYRINFQDYENSKRAYSAAFGVRFGEIGVSAQVLETMQQFMHYRHRVVHGSPMENVLNAPEVPPEAPIMAGIETSAEALAIFDTFIRALQARTVILQAE